MDIGKRLKKLREQNKIKQKEIALATGIPVVSISHYENGEKIPPPDKIRLLAKFYHVTTDYLLCMDESSTEQVIVIGNLGERLKQIRLSRHFSHKDFAKFIGVPPKELEKIESGEVPPADEIQRICNWLEIDSREFLNEKEVPLYPDIEIAKALTFAADKENLPYMKIVMAAKEKGFLPSDIVIGQKLI